MSAPLPEPIPIPAPPVPAPIPAPIAPAAPVGPSKARIVGRALVAALTSKQAVKIEFALVRYVVYAVAAALGVHDHFLGL